MTLCRPRVDVGEGHVHELKHVLLGPLEGVHELLLARGLRQVQVSVYAKRGRIGETSNH